MFLDTKNLGPRPEPLPERPRPKLSPRQEKTLVWILTFNLLLMLIAPIGGATVINGIVALFTR